MQQSDRDRKPGEGRTTRGRAARNPTAGQNRPASRGTVPVAAVAGPSHRRVSPTSAALQGFEDLHIGGNGGEEPSRYEGGDDNGGNGNGNGSRRGDGNGHEGNGNGRGDASAGLRGSGRGPRTLEQMDIIRTRPEGLLNKKGATGELAQLVANYFLVECRENWCLYQYRVDFAPELDHIGTMKYLLREHASKIGTYIFDGTMLFTTAPLCEAGRILEFTGIRTRDQVTFKFTIRLVGRVDPGTPMYIQFYNIVVRKFQEELKLTLMGRNYFDSSAAIRLPRDRLELWPGFVTVMRQHEQSLLLCVETTHKLIRSDSVLTVMNGIRREVEQRGGGYQQVQAEVAKQLVGTVVLTGYNKRTYHVDDILWDEHPTDTFPFKTGQISFKEYYQNKHGIAIRGNQQPLLLSNPSKRDIRRGQTGPIKLIPELCQMTGLTQQMKQNFQLMNELNRHLFQPPQAKLQQVVGFVQRIKASPTITAEMKLWGLDIIPRPIPVLGRVLPKEKVNFRDGRNQGALVEYKMDDKTGDWNNAFRYSHMATSIPLKNWVVIVAQKEWQNMDAMYKTMEKVATPLGFQISKPLEMVKLNDFRPEAYARAVTEMYTKYKETLQMIFVVLQTNSLEPYAAVKKKCNVEYGIPSQCYVAKNLQQKGIMSKATKVVVQMNAKLGGEPWLLSIPLKRTMIVGFDVYHGGAAGSGSQGGRSISAMVSTTGASYGRYYSSMSLHDSRNEISTKVGSDLFKCIKAWEEINKALPDRIIFYRDGVGEGQLEHVVFTEVEAVKKCILGAYSATGKSPAMLTYVVVTKRINTRFFLQIRNNFNNPTPGTVVDDVVTWPERYDFFLIAQGARQGTVSPTSFNIISDNNGLDANKLQILTYKLCHGYYNWSGTVAVPAPCQYAHKLAYLTGTATKAQTDNKLSHLLYYL